MSEPRHTLRFLFGGWRQALHANQPARRSVTNFLPFLSGSGEKARQQVAAVPIPLDGIGLGAAGIRSTNMATLKISTT